MKTKTSKENGEKKKEGEAELKAQNIHVNQKKGKEKREEN